MSERSCATLEKRQPHTGCTALFLLMRIWKKNGYTFLYTIRLSVIFTSVLLNSSSRTWGLSAFLPFTACSSSPGHTKLLIQSTLDSPACCYSR